MTTQRKVHWIQVKIAFREGMDHVLLRADKDGVTVTDSSGSHRMACGRLDELWDRIGDETVPALASLRYSLLAVPMAEPGCALPEVPTGNPLATRMVDGESVEMMTSSPNYRIWLYRIDPVDDGER